MVMCEDSHRQQPGMSGAPTATPGTEAQAALHILDDLRKSAVVESFHEK